MCISHLSGRKALAKIDIATSGDNTVIAAPTSGHIEIDHITLVAGDAVEIIFKDGSTAFTGAMSFGQNGSYAYDNTAPNAIALTDASAFKINLSASIQVSGFVVYRVVGQ